MEYQSNSDSHNVLKLAILDIMQQREEVSELLKLLIGPSSNSEIPDENLRYILYARKSTVSEDRQERSISDQIQECITREVKPNNLHIVEVVEESASAKVSGTRLKFEKMIKDIQNGKADGIITWHPDRLARNMKEAGEIIDLLDRGILKDLRFATSAFENSPTGKMLLGISFVLSKQYSEHLSESVSRGNRRKTADGLYIGKMKHGYYIDANDRLQPEEGSFPILRQAFDKRLAGESQLSIAKWLNASEYRVRKRGQQLQSYVWDSDAMSKLFRDPLYAGILKHGLSQVNLLETYDFIPLITVEEYMKLNKQASGSNKMIATGPSRRLATKANLARGIVFCGFCNKSFSSGLIKKKLKTGDKFYYNYKCETEGCEFKGKSVRARVMLNVASEFFKEYLFVTEENYNAYKTEAIKSVAKLAKDLDRDIGRMNQRLLSEKRSYEQDKELIRNNPALSSHYDLDKRVERIKSVEVQLKDLRYRKSEMKSVVMTYEKYLKLFENIGVIMSEMQNMELLDQVIKKFFSNFTIKQLGRGKEQRWDITYKLKEPWQGFLESNNFVHGRGERAQTFDLSVPNRARYQLRHTPMVTLVIIR
jgi:DNA invertase Pin-like site-specific DNA recombinase